MKLLVVSPSTNEPVRLWKYEKYSFHRCKFFKVEAKLCKKSDNFSRKSVADIPPVLNHQVIRSHHMGSITVAAKLVG